ncbi:competence protein ComEC [Geodermatophilus obscurus]|uniref:Competence protein ComEC n=1 Tax=Geodermatophilus obscurus TaxID=1861 RepID=A0A1I5HMG2_9ACTN|nr:ComEC/Rec2 family competence protein [Geodermatophilus obscurus]SFO49485.1 competence protein ComEC [Geodermatophilus obscurus]
MTGTTGSRAAPPRWTWVDLRLVPVAVAVWAVTLGAGHVPPLVSVAVAAAAVLCAAVVVTRRDRSGALVVLVVLAAVATAATAAAVRGAVHASSPLTELGGDRQVHVVLEVDGDPRRIGGAAAPRLVLDATVTALEDGGGTARLSAVVVVFAPEDGWTGLLPGQLVRARVTVSPAAPADGVVARLSARGPPEPVGGAPWVQRAAGGVRDGLADSADRVLDSPAAGLLPGLVVGDTRAMDPVLTEDFRRAGLSHLTAVSGANVSIVLAGVLAPLRRRAADPRLQALVAVVALAGFVVLARPSASVVRAAAMGAVGLLALASGRSRAALPALSASVVVLLLLDPRLARDAGFALSVTATAAIVLLAPGWSRRLRGRGSPGVLADAVAVAAAAGLATAPLVAGLSGLVSPVSLPANLLAAPAVAPATVLGLLAALVGAVVPLAGDALVWLAGWPVRWLVAVARAAASLPDGASGWPAGTRGALLLTLLLLAAGLLLWRHPRLRALALAVLVGVVVLGWPLRQVSDGWPRPDAVIVACDVGQGDGLVVPTGPGEAVLVDAGPEVGPIDRCLDRLGVDVLPLVLLSHLDADHVGGLVGALSGRDVGTIATGTLSPADDRSAALDAQAGRAGARREVLLPGDVRTVGSATFEVLAPPAEIVTAAAEPNDLSLVVRVTHRGVRVLLTGDLGAAAEARLLARGVDLTADVLKVPHHGSADADEAFLAATGARIAVISVGADNTYGHPAPGLLSTLVRAGMRVHRTDLHGDLAVVGDADDWGVVGDGQVP